MLHRASSKWLDEFSKEHKVFRRPLNALLLSASSSYMLSEKEPFKQVLPLYMEFKDAFISHHERNEEGFGLHCG